MQGEFGGLSLAMREAVQPEGREIEARSASQREIGQDHAGDGADAKTVPGEAGGDDEPVEAGIGVAAFAHTKYESNDMGSAFQFEDRIGFGLRFAGGHEVGIRAIHYSNAGLKEPNDGVESYALHYRMAL